METVPIEVWFGDSDRNPIGPIEGKLIEINGQTAKIEITDKFWLDNMGWDDEPYTYTCSYLPADKFVRYDDYAWCYLHEGGPANKWW
jgi:hypothetical protein